MCELRCPDFAIEVHEKGEESECRPTGSWIITSLRRPCMTKNAKLMQGNEACTIGALAAGLEFYAGYPITPSTEIAELCAEELPKVGGKFIQMEDEIGSIAACIGASLTGKKAMTATSGPGFSLMQECLGYASLTEVPIVIVDVQRMGPSTGMPTSSGPGRPHAGALGHARRPSRHSPGARQRQGMLRAHFQGLRHRRDLARSRHRPHGRDHRPHARESRPSRSFDAEAPAPRRSLLARRLQALRGRPGRGRAPDGALRRGLPLRT